MFNYSQMFSNLGSFAEVITGVLGIAITVVTIIVELAATRYTPKISDLFIRNYVNICVLSFYIVTCLVGIWIIVFDPNVHSIFIPILTWVYLILVTLSFLSILPYFFYVFNFLHPENIINLLEQQSHKYLDKAKTFSGNLSFLKNRFFQTVEQISDIGINSIASFDRSLGLACVDSLKRILISYFPIKLDFRNEWFTIDHENFLGFSRESIQKIEDNHTWIEMLILKQFEFLLAKSVKQIRELVQEISNATREISIAAAKTRLKETIELLVIYFNTFLRISLNERNQYAIYNLCDQYRCFAEKMLEIDEELALQIARYFLYYGQFSLTASMPFTMVIASHDLRILNEKAYVTSFRKQEKLLDIFLDLDKPPESKLDEIGFRGVRKSQAILAGFYLELNEESLARRIYDDMKHEPLERLQSIRDEILAVEKERFWEVTDRWINFDFVSNKRREKVIQFFKWFEKAG